MRADCSTTILDIMSKAEVPSLTIWHCCLPWVFPLAWRKKEKEVAALSGAIAYLVMNTAISALISAKGGVEAMAANSTTSVLGITTLQMGVFGGILVGLGVAALHNRFYKIELPQVLSFFGGTRFVPIISTVVYLFVGVIMFFPVAGGTVRYLSSGNAGASLRLRRYMDLRHLERALIPFGLHHVFYMPFWQTELGRLHDDRRQHGFRCPEHLLC